MKVELERKTTTAGERLVTVSCSDTTSNATTIEQWIKMLRLAQKWLRNGKLGR